MVSLAKDPTKQRAGLLGAEARWGPPGTRTVKIGDLSPEARRLVVALVDAAKKAPAPLKADALEVDRHARDRTTAS